MSFILNLKSFIQLFKQALRGDLHDYTEGSIPKAVFLLSIPMILELSLESVFAVVDIFFVSKLGPNAIATVGLTESVITLIYSLAIGLSTAATAVVARRIGEKNPEAASQTGVQALIIALIISIIISILGLIFAGDLLRLMNASDDVVKEGTPFARIMLGTSFVIILLFLINGIFRGAGDAAIAMRSLWIASAINIILCPIMIHFFGLKGAAIATVIGRSTGIAYQCKYLFGGSELIHIKKEIIQPVWSIIRNLIDVAWPATFQFLIASGSWIIIARLIADIGGTNASAGYQIAIRSIVFFILPAWGMSNAVATLVGQNLGAGKIDRAIESVNITTKYNAIFMFMVMILFVFFSEPIIQIFTDNPEIVSKGSEALKIFGYGYVFYGIGMVMTQALNGAGDTRTPTYINLICFWLIQIPLAYFLAGPLSLYYTGAALAIPISESILALIAWYYFNKGNWKTIKV
ncbi:MAG: MATE family efflux transporter [Saprospiraceae bacterium]|nr:MATE family efflux transporter [Saprospiraceae bacterium]